jgi:enoyl-CoA hydratase
MDRYAAYKYLAFERDGGVLTVTLNPATPLNVITGALHTELASVFDTIRHDSATDAVVLTGSGQAFSGGGDLHWLHDMTPSDRDMVFDEGRRIVVDLLELPQPIIAAIEGPAVGLGATLALFCDVRIAARGSRIGDPHVRVGVVAGDGGAVIWPWLIGARAKYYLMTGDLVPGPEAERLGLVDQLVDDGDALSAARALAARLASGYRKAIRGTKASVNKLLREAANLVLDTSLALEKETMTSDEHRQAVAALLESSRR